MITLVANVGQGTVRAMEPVIEVVPLVTSLTDNHWQNMAIAQGQTSLRADNICDKYISQTNIKL